MGMMDDLIPVEDESVEKVLVRLMEPDGIALKTDLPNPMNCVKLATLANWLRQEAMVDSAELIDTFIRCYMEDMVSNKRLGRGEIVRALQERLKEEAKSRWTGKGEQVEG